MKTLFVFNSFLRKSFVR